MTQGIFYAIMSCRGDFLMKQTNWKTEFNEIVGELRSTPEVQSLRTLHHHRNTNRYDHTMRVAELSFRWAKRLHMDKNAAARAAILHDLFYHDNTCRPANYRGWAAVKHPEEAVVNARKLTTLSPKEENIILSHMWPASRHAPHSREAVLVNVIDDIVAVRDYFRGKST